MITKETWNPKDPNNLTPEEQAFADSLPMDELRELAERDFAEMERRQELAAVVATRDENTRDKMFEGWTPEQIAQRLRDKTEQEKINASPENQQDNAEQIAQAQAEARAAELAKQVENLQYVNDQLQHQTDSQLDQRIRQNVAQEMAVQRSLETQRLWCSKRPEYVMSVENGNMMRDYVAARYNEFTYANLEEAFNALHDKLTLRQVTSEPTPEPRTSKRASSVSTVQSSTSMYDRKTEPTAEDLENMPMDKFLELGRTKGFIDPEAEMHEGIVPRHTHTSFLPQF